MSGKISLSDEGMEEVRASEAFRALDPDRASELEEYLYTALAGENALPIEEARNRLDRYLEGAVPDPALIREVILSATAAP